MNSTNVLESASPSNGSAELISKIFFYFWILFSILDFIGILGNAWKILTLIISGNRLKNFKVYFYVTFIVDFLTLSVF